MKLESIVHIIDIYFRPLVIVISTAITILLSWKKIGNSVSANYKIVSDLLSATRIDHIVLVNYKDKPVPVFAIPTTSTPLSTCGIDLSCIGVGNK